MPLLVSSFPTVRPGFLRSDLCTFSFFSRLLSFCLDLVCRGELYLASSSLYNIAFVRYELERPTLTMVQALNRLGCIISRHHRISGAACLFKPVCMPEQARAALASAKRLLEQEIIRQINPLLLFEVLKDKSREAACRAIEHACLVNARFFQG